MRSIPPSLTSGTHIVNVTAAKDQMCAFIIEFPCNAMSAKRVTLLVVKCSYTDSKAESNLNELVSL